jgi:hypothetical protein
MLDTAMIFFERFVEVVGRPVPESPGQSKAGRPGRRSSRRSLPKPVPRVIAESPSFRSIFRPWPVVRACPIFCV